jgi:hypothetical protein
MTRFAWLQSRTQTLVTAAALAALAVAAAITGIHLAHLYDSLVAGCSANSDCPQADLKFLSHDNFLQHAFELLLRAVPALLGIFWGGPLLSRELETGTFRLAWTQTVNRSRWLVIKLALGGLLTIAIAGLLSVTVTWWYSDIDKVQANQYAVFDARDIAPIAYALFAFALGALAGAAIKRTLPAMAVTLGVFVFTRVAVVEWVRPHLLGPVHESVSLQGANDVGFIINNGGSVHLEARAEPIPNAWIQSTHIITNATGHVSTGAEQSAFLHQYCAAIAQPPPPSPAHQLVGPGPVAVHTCREQAGRVFHLLVAYQPAGRYWAFQWMEFGIFLFLALAAAAACYWWVVRRGS